MNNRSKTRLQSKKVQVKPDKEEVEVTGNNQRNAASKPVKTRRVLSGERKISLQQDVNKLKKKLRYEENVHRALERAFNRPLGALPRLPPYLPASMLELLAEVAVLEEEVVRLEEQVVHFRQGLYQEAVYISSSKRNVESFADLYDLSPDKNTRQENAKTIVRKIGELTSNVATQLPSLSVDGQGKENQLCANSVKNNKSSLINKAQPSKTTTKKPSFENKPTEKRVHPQKLQVECKAAAQEKPEARNGSTANEHQSGDYNPNKISEDIVRCLSNIYLRMSSRKTRRTAESLPFLSTLVSLENDEEIDRRDPYGIYSEFEKKDIGPYKHFINIESGTINTNRTSSSLFLLHRLKHLLEKLASVKLQKLTHQEKLAFWINIYNSCMMNAFLEHGIPENPEMIVALMQKATINVGGHSLNAITIEHFILRLPYHLKYAYAKGTKNDEMTARCKFGLELSEPLVTFALSCGSWSSPAVRVYTASQVENELDVAKREYLQAAVGISTRKFAIPKLLDWYLLDFAKDLESLLDWICLQLPSELGKEAIKRVERGKSEPHSQFVQIMPYEFSFRYLLRTQ